MKKFVVLAAICSGLVITACNTVAGAGRDIESVGDTIEDAAE